MLAMNLYNKIYPNKEIPALETKFADCSDDPNVNNAAALGIVTGYEDGTFRPYKTISRQEAATMLDRLYAALGGQTELIADPAYADDAQLGDWARGSVYAMRQTGIMQGKENNRFCPTDGYTAVHCDHRAHVSNHQITSHTKKDFVLTKSFLLTHNVPWKSR